MISQKETKKMKEELEQGLPVEEEEQEADKVGLLLNFIEENAINADDLKKALLAIEKEQEPTIEDGERAFGMKFLRD